MPLRNLLVGTTIDISEVVNIYDVYGERIELSSADVSVISNDKSRLTVTQNKNLLFNEAGPCSFNVSYCYQNDPDHRVTLIVPVEGKTHQGLTTLQGYRGFFDFKCIDVRSIVASIVTGQLLNELDDSYERNHLSIFASALRSVLELALEDFKKEAQRVAPMSKWATATAFNDLSGLFKAMTIVELEAVIGKFCRLPGISISYNTLRNYLIANITATATGHTLDAVVSVLHLGAHKSLKTLNTVNLMQIQPYLNAWLELIYVLIEIGFTV